MLWKTGLIILCWGLSSGELQDGQSGTPAAPARRTLDFGFVPSGVYETVAYYEPGAIGILFNMMHAFLYVVQPNPFPEGELNPVVFVNFWTPLRINLMFPSLIHLKQVISMCCHTISPIAIPYHECVRKLPPVIALSMVNKNV